MDENDPRDPYILGQPMGRKALLVFVTIMLVLPTIMLVVEGYNSYYHRGPQQSCAARGLQQDTTNARLCWAKAEGGRFTPVDN